MIIQVMTHASAATKLALVYDVSVKAFLAKQRYANTHTTSGTRRSARRTSASAPSSQRCSAALRLKPTIHNS
jgi:hypothetical protein